MLRQPPGSKASCGGSQGRAALLQPRVRALVAGHAQPLIDQVPQPARFGQRHHRHQPRQGHEIRIIKGDLRRPKRVREFHPTDALRDRTDWTLDKSQSPSHKGIRLSRHAHNPHPIGGSGLSPDRLRSRAFRGRHSHPMARMDHPRDSHRRDRTAAPGHCCTTSPSIWCSPPSSSPCSSESCDRLAASVT